MHGCICFHLQIVTISHIWSRNANAAIQENVPDDREKGETARETATTEDKEVARREQMRETRKRNGIRHPINNICN